MAASYKQDEDKKEYTNIKSHTSKTLQMVVFCLFHMYILDSWCLNKLNIFILMDKLILMDTLGFGTPLSQSNQLLFYIHFLRLRNKLYNLY